MNSDADDWDKMCINIFISIANVANQIRDQVGVTIESEILNSVVCYH